MNRLSIEKRTNVVKALVEGVGVNSASRLTGVCKPAIFKLLADLGHACFRFHDERVRGLKPERLETDEVWSFVFCKEKSLREEVKGTYGINLAIRSQNKRFARLVTARRSQIMSIQSRFIGLTITGVARIRALRVVRQPKPQDWPIIGGRWKS